MLKLNDTALRRYEKDYPGIREMIRQFESAILPPCPACRSEDTAVVSCGAIGRSIAIAAATSKFRLLANGPAPGKYYCLTCKGFFNDIP